MAEAQTWSVEFNDSGEVPQLPGDQEGVLRIGSGDSIVFTLPAGSQPLLAGLPQLVARDELGHDEVMEGSMASESGDWLAEWCPRQPGPFEIFLQSQGSTSPTACAPCRMVVDPMIQLRGEPLNAKSIVQFTVLSRLAGPIERWPETLGSQGTLGYNMVHFTPVQPPGDSGSCYALDDQNAVDASLLEAPGSTQQERFEVLKTAVSRLETEHGMLSAMDVVLNHTAGTAPWLLDHPECAYSVTNSPHLTAAAELDERLVWYSNQLRDGSFGGPHINSHDDVNRVIDGIRTHVLEHLKLREYFLVDEAACCRVRAEASPSFARDDYEAFKDSALASIGAKRHGVVITGEAALCFCPNEQTMRGWLRRLQEELHKTCDAVEQEILESCRGLITWERLEMKKGPVGNGDKMLMPAYFRRLELSEKGKEQIGKDTEVVAHNGWVMGWPATEDFAAPTWRFVYLRRQLCAWGDCVKLRYGNKPEDVPFLWEHMTKYVTTTASIFHAIRIDNCHSTPLAVSRYMFAQIRKARPHCWIFAELFTGNFHTDLLYQKTLGINALVREAMQCNSPWDIADKLTSNLWGAHPLGEISAVPTLDRLPLESSRTTAMPRSSSCCMIAASVVPLRPRHCPALLYDCTHDNETPHQKRHARDALPNAALVAASCASVGSVRGYDELVPENPSVVFERRLYQEINGVKPLELGWPSNAAVQQRAPDVEQTVPSDLEVTLSWNRGDVSSVVARGSWDGWKEDVIFEKGANGWSATMRVPLVSLPLQYKFIVDGDWTSDSQQPSAPDGFGGHNNVYHGPTLRQEQRSSDSPVSGPDAPENYLPGIFTVKQVLNMLHVKLGSEGFTELGVHRLSDDILAVQRRAPNSGRSAWFVVRCAFAKHGLWDGLPDTLPVLEVPGTISRLHVAATLYIPDKEFRPDQKLITGLECYLRMYSSLQEVASSWQNGENTMVKMTQFPPGSVLVFSTDPVKDAASREGLDRLLEAEAIERPLQDLTLSDFNYLLFSCEAEELDRSNGKRGSYVVNGYGPFMYCGLMGVCATLDSLRASLTEQDLLASPVLQNIQEGDWLLDYLTSRLDEMPSLKPVRDWMCQVKTQIARFPRQFVPFCFDLAIPALCSAAVRILLQGFGTLLSGPPGESPLVRHLALATAQFWGATQSAPLHWERSKKEGWRALPSLCAGLPHFSSGFMRNWGRDTFISLRGGLLVTQRFAEAKETLLVYGSVVRHGLCPNLLDAANNSRYNARDATWFFLQGIQDYVEMAPEGVAFLATPLSLKWPVKEWDKDLAHLEPQTVGDLVHLIFAAHAKGITFREWNAGPQIDGDMTDKGFDVEVRLDEDTGIIYGGSEWNCGTWMDKMGSSSLAGNKGVPATPRDGAAVEIIGLLKSALRWVSSLKADVFSHTFVKTASGADLCYKEWDAKLLNSFERVFWVGPDEKVSGTALNIYKDTDRASRDWQDYQLRPNFCIAMTVAPELFTPCRARLALNTVAERLMGPYGMCTLDPADKEYRGDYHNDNDSTDKSIAHGWNYHQGPEWVWPRGFFLQAWHRFVDNASESDDKIPDTTQRQRKMRWLLQHRTMLSQGAWRSLPELTNSKGAVCDHSCPAQAWSVATLLDALHTFACSSASQVA